MLKNVVLAAAAVTALIALGSCGSQNVGTTGPNFSNGNAVSSAFKLDVIDNTFDYGATAQDLSLAVSTETDTHVVVDVKATGAEGLKGLYFKVEYDANKYRPMIVEPTSAMGDKDNMIKLMAIERPGLMQYGQTLIHQDYQVGFTGTATLAQISFRKEATPAQRATSTALTDAASAVTTLAFDGVDKLTWSYAFKGDYGQDGTVSVADLQPLGANLNAVSPGGAGTPFPYTDAKSQIDGDSNGVLAITDLQSIGAGINGKADVFNGFHIYSSAAASDYPSPPTAANGAGATDIGSVAVSGAVNIAQKSSQRLTYEFTVPAPVANDVYWIRPQDGTGANGIASGFVGGNPADLPALSLAPATPALSGSGTQADPYVFDKTLTYNFVLLDKPGGVDVTTDANTVFTVTPSSTGTFGTNNGILDLDDTIAGTLDFTVTATYNGTPNSSATNIYGHIGAVVTPAPVIDKDPADNDWATVTGDGSDDNNAYILRTAAFNDTYSLTFSLQATAGAGGAVLLNSDLDWDAFPPFAVSDPAAFTADATAGTFQVWEFTSGYVFAQDASNQNSNNLYIAVNSLPN
jgi:hypothetical protein